MLIQTEYSLHLVFNGMRATRGGRENAGVAVLTFDRALVSKFGYPNDEALVGHPVLGAASIGYDVVEIHDSSWCASAERENRVAFPKSDFRHIRHFAVSMHDSTFECLAAGIAVEVSRDPYESVVKRLVDRALQDPR
jgi:hypothetical protein